MNVEDQKIIYEFLKTEKNNIEQVSSPKKPDSQKFDLNQLAKIVDYLSKDYYNTLLEKLENNQGPDREKQFMSMSKKAISTLEVFLEQLQQKLRI